jgi:CHAT domain-containing protein
LLAKTEIKSSAASKNLLIFSDPVFSAGDSRLANNKRDENATTEAVSSESFRFAESLNLLPRLNASKDEADSIINIVGSSKSQAFSGFSANRQQLLNSNVSDFKIIHFATHSLVNEERPELSGIVLSRFDEKGEKLDEFVRLQDIYAMNLNNDLVVLSACNTGNGKEVKGEGLMSLNNAFLQVGAKSVLSSLWKVDDNATKELMKDFYQGLASEKMTTAEALRQAQIKLAKNPQYKSPFYWAAFTIQGDFQNKPVLSVSINYKIYFLLVIPLLSFLIYRLCRTKSLHRQAVNQI